MTNHKELADKAAALLRNAQAYHADEFGLGDALGAALVDLVNRQFTHCPVKPLLIRNEHGAVLVVRVSEDIVERAMLKEYANLFSADGLFLALLSPEMRERILLDGKSIP